MPTTVAQEDPACAQIIEKPLPLVIVVDRSDNRHRDEYLATIEQLETAIVEHPLASATIETAVVAFDPVEVLQSFRPVRHPGTTYLGWGEPGPIGPAITRALDLITERREQYRRLGVRCVYRPVIVLLTDKSLDATNDADRKGFEALRAHLDARRVHCWPLVPTGVSPQTLDVLASFRAGRCADTNGLWRWLLGLPPPMRPVSITPPIPALPPGLFEVPGADNPIAETEGGRRHAHARLKPEA